jgi:hypothetical protein
MADTLGALKASVANFRILELCRVGHELIMCTAGENGTKRWGGSKRAVVDVLSRVATINERKHSSWALQ